MKLALALIFTLFISCKTEKNQNSSECLPPWQKVNENICLFLNSVAKTRSHAKFLCHFYGGELLFINDQNEQTIIQKYLNKLIKYRFNKKPYVWLDAIDPYADGHWTWTRNNETITYENWMSSKSINSNVGLNDCACLKLKDGFWKDCDCLLTQHYVCRKTDSKDANLDILMRTTSTTTYSSSTSTTDATTTTTSLSTIATSTSAHIFTNKVSTDSIYHVNRNSFFMENMNTSNEPNLMNVFYDDLNKQTTINEDEEDDDLRQNNFLNLEDVQDKAIIVSTRVFMDEEEKLKKDIIDKYNEKSDTVEALLNLNEKPIKSTSKLLKMKGHKKRPMNNENFSAKNTLRITVEKHLASFTSFFCPYSFGFYLVEGSRCQKYRVCEDWDTNHAIFSQYDCGINKMFSLTGYKCVPAAKSICEPATSTFVSLYLA